MDVQEPTESDAIFDLRDKCMIAQIELHLHEKNLRTSTGSMPGVVTRRLKTKAGTQGACLLPRSTSVRLRGATPRNR